MGSLIIMLGIIRITRMKRITFSFKPEPTNDREENQEWRNYATRKYPKLERWVHVAGFAILAAAIAVGYWMKHPNIGLFVGVAACFVLVIFSHPLRCPQCKGPVATRLVEYEHGYRQHFHDCAVCKITWECEKFRESDS